jgi:hypothetical protein
MVKIEIHKYGPNGSINLEDECEMHELDERVDRLVSTLKGAVEELGIKSHKKVEDED